MRLLRTMGCARLVSNRKGDPTVWGLTEEGKRCGPARHAGTLIAALALAITSHPARAQRYDDQCRLLPTPGYVMQPGAPDPGCLQSRQESRLKEQTRTSFERQRCVSVSDADLRNVMSQAPIVEAGRLRIVDLERPTFDENRSACYVRAMTNRGVVPAIIGFETFNGQTYLNVRMIFQPGW